MLVCDWLHSVGQNQFYAMMLFNWDLVIQSSSRRFCTVYKSVKSDPSQPSGLCDIPSGFSTVQASSVRTTRTFHLDLPLCREDSNCSSLHPSGRFSSTSGCHSVFYQILDFFPKHRYWKTAAIVWTMWIPVWMPLSVRMRQPLIWKLHAAKVQPSGRGSIQERISTKFGKLISQLSVWMPYVYCPDGA